MLVQNIAIELNYYKCVNMCASINKALLQHAELNVQGICHEH